MTNLLNMKEENAVLALDKFLRDNPEMMKHQVELEDRMKHISDPKVRLSFLMNEIKIQQKELSKIFNETVGRSERSEHEQNK